MKIAPEQNGSQPKYPILAKAIAVLTATTAVMSCDDRGGSPPGIVPHEEPPKHSPSSPFKLSGIVAPNTIIPRNKGSEQSISPEIRELIDACNTDKESNQPSGMNPPGAPPAPADNSNNH